MWSHHSHVLPSFAHAYDPFSSFSRWHKARARLAVRPKANDSNTAASSVRGAQALNPPSNSATSPDPITQPGRRNPATSPETIVNSHRPSAVSPAPPEVNQVGHA
jgi:hypothetical protein